MALDINKITNEKVKSVISSFSDKTKIQDGQVVKNGVQITKYDGVEPDKTSSDYNKLYSFLDYLKRNGFNEGSSGQQYFYFSPNPKSLVILSLPKNTSNNNDVEDEDYLGDYLDSTGLSKAMEKTAGQMGSVITKGLGVNENVQNEIERIKNLLK
jgi:hypothetical protein